MVPLPIHTVAALRQALAHDPRPSRLRELIDAAPLAVLVADDSRRYVAVNEQACALTGYSDAELLCMSLPELAGAPDGRAADVLWQAFLDQGEQRGEFTLRRKNGTRVLVRYDAATNVLPGLHVSMLNAVD